MAVPSKARIKAHVFYQLPEYAQHDTIQLIDGEVVIEMPPIPKHQAIVGEILFLLMTIAKQLGGKAFTSPIEVYLDEHNIYEPDVLYLAPNSTCVVEEKRLNGAPELVVEVLSPSTAKFDRQEKYQAYEAHGVKEYWIVDPVHAVLEIWVLEDEAFIRQGVYDKTDILKSKVLGQDIELASIFPQES